MSVGTSFFFNSFNDIKNGILISMSNDQNFITIQINNQCKKQNHTDEIRPNLYGLVCFKRDMVCLVFSGSLFKKQTRPELMSGLVTFAF